MSLTLSPISVVEPRDTELTYQEIAEDREIRRQFSDWAFQHAGVLNSTLRDANLICGMTNIVYLVDADVVRNLLQTPDQDPRRRREAMQFLGDPDISFALPSGAFQEILSWVRELAPNLSGWTDEPSLNGRTPIEAIGELREIFAIHDSQEDGNLAKSAKSLFAAISDRRLVVETLNSLLSQGNFRGVVGDYKASDEAEISGILKKLERPRKKRGTPRTDIDRRDAINLSILCGHHHRRTLHQGSKSVRDVTSYVLVTQTRILLDLAKEASPDSWKVLSSLFGEPNALPPGLYPVLSPERAFMVEEVRRSIGLKRETLKALNSRAFEFNNLGILLNQQDSNVDSNRSISLPTVEQLRNLISSLSTLYLHEPALFRDIEKRRSLEASLQFFERSHKVDVNPGDTLLKQLKSESESFFRVLSRLEDTMAEKAGINYDLQRKKADGLVQQFVVYCDQPRDTVLEGEIYQADPSIGIPFSWSTRWATRATEMDFFASVDNLLSRQLEGKSRQRALILERTEVLPDKFEGILVFSNTGVFSVDFEGLPRGWGLKQLKLSKILTGIAELMGGSFADVIVSAIRVVTRFGDFQLDVIAADASTREVFIVSNVNLSKQVSRLCMDTSIFGIVPLRLNDRLAELLQPFPSANHSDNPGATA